MISSDIPQDNGQTSSYNRSNGLKLVNCNRTNLWHNFSWILISLSLIFALAAAKPPRLNSRILDLTKLDTNDNNIRSHRNILRKHINIGNEFENVDTTNKKSSIANFSSSSPHINSLFEKFLKDQEEKDPRQQHSTINNNTHVKHGFVSTRIELPDVHSIPSFGTTSSANTLPSHLIGSNTHNNDGNNGSMILDLTSLSEYFPLYRRLMEGLTDEERLTKAWSALRDNKATNLFEVAAILLRGESH